MGRVIFYALGMLLAIGGLAVLYWLAYQAGFAMGKRKTYQHVTGESVMKTRRREELVATAEGLFEEMTRPPTQFDVQATFLTPEHHQQVREWRANVYELEKKK
jgi:hypothetical protein